jgi:hypothetical protein
VSEYIACHDQALRATGGVSGELLRWKLMNCGYDPARPRGAWRRRLGHAYAQDRHTTNKMPM